VKLFEHDEFEQAMLRAAEHFAVSEQFVEKDYYVTEILRVIADRLGARAMFKGGTSLSKGWGLITRFSEDIDLFVNPDAFEPRPGKNKMDKILKELAAGVGEHPALSWIEGESVTISGLGRADYFAYDTRFAALPEIRAAVRLEPGMQSGTFPTELVTITSLVGQYLQEQGLGRPGRRSQRLRHDAPALPAHVRGEDVRPPRQGDPPATGRSSTWSRCPPLPRPVRAGRPARGSRDARITRVRRDPAGLR
jgi:hypothetical protein